MVACGMELPSFMQLSCNILFQGFRYNRGLARNGEKERGREQGILLPAFYRTPTPCFVGLLTHFSSCCLHYLNAWHRLPGDGCLKKNGFCTPCCAVYKPLTKGKKIGSVTVHLPL